ncbi:putative PEP-binding protein [Vibrio metschnikovii]|uniref:putative PEP-binding protein n=1 Tax=Vibrio metschnikovii TaxID=28172 RepID=UPI001C3067BD|nr:putative PEP-binding protein [Vibrio metschnikovii]
MSVVSPSSINKPFEQGNTLPQWSQQTLSSTLFVVISELIADSIFYHPSLVTDLTQLSEPEESSLNALLNDQSIAEHFVDTLVERIEQAIKPHHQSVRVCLSNEDSAQSRTLLGGEKVTVEPNPALGVRGVARLTDSEYADAFELECNVIKRLISKGHPIEIVVPFVRSLSDAAGIIDGLAEQGLPRGLHGLQVSFVCQVPSAALLAERLLAYFDGMLLDWDSLAQFTLATDNTVESLVERYQPTDNDAVFQLAEIAIKAVHQTSKPLSILVSEQSVSTKIQRFLSEIAQPDSVYYY